MKKSLITIGLIVLIVLGFASAGYFYVQNTNLNSQNDDLESQNAQIRDEREQCRTEVQGLNSKLSMLTDDVAKIYKTCITDNVCKGHYPGVRWNCNNVGDETNVNPSHVCVCDSACNLNITQIVR